MYYSGLEHHYCGWLNTIKINCWLKQGTAHIKIWQDEAENIDPLCPWICLLCWYLAVTEHARYILKSWLYSNSSQRSSPASVTLYVGWMTGQATGWEQCQERVPSKHPLTARIESKHEFRLVDCSIKVEHPLNFDDGTPS